MARTATRLLATIVIVAVTVCLGAVASSRATTAKAYTQTLIGPMRFVSPDFGYVVAYRTAFTSHTLSNTFGLFLYDHGRWRDATPPVARGVNTIDDVSFSDPQHGWVAEYNCGPNTDYVYRTVNGGHTWHFLGKPTIRSCGGGPTFLSFVDSEHGWMEPLQPNAPAGGLLQTNDGGSSWRTIIKPINDFPSSRYFCIGPMSFISPSSGWAARCDGHLLVSHDAGVHWNGVDVDVKPDTAHSFDTPKLSGEVGAMAAVLGRKRASNTAFFTSSDGGGTWTQRELRPIAPCPLRTNGGFYQTFWPESIASPPVWWVVSSGSKQTTVQLTKDAGRHWSSITATGLPPLTCSVTDISAVSASDAWAVATTSSRFEKQGQVTIISNWVFTTSDGGRTWKRVELKPRARLSS